MRILHHESVTATLQPRQPPEVEVRTAGPGSHLVLPEALGGNPVTGSTNPEQLFGSAYAGCMVFAVEHAVRLARLGPSAAAGVSATAEVRIGRAVDRTNRLEVDLRVEVPGVDQATAERVVDVATRYCPFHQAIHGNVAATMTVVGAAAVPDGTGSDAPEG